MKMTNLLVAVAAIALLAACQPAQKKDETTEPPPAAAETETPAAPTGSNIVTLAGGNADLSTLVTAINAADPAVATALSGTEQYTVFAPNNAAFAKVDKAALDKLLADKAGLTTVLQGHVVAGETLSTALAEGETKVKTLAGTELTIVRKGADVTVNGAKVVAADIDASNGVVHVIDTVILPAPKK